MKTLSNAAIDGIPQAQLPKQLLGVDETTHVLSISRTAVFDLIAKGELKSMKIGKRRLISMESVEALVQRRLSEAS